MAESRTGVGKRENPVSKATRSRLDRAWGLVYAASSPALAWFAGDAVGAVQALEDHWVVGFAARFGMLVQDLQEDARRTVPISRLGKTGVVPDVSTLAWYVADQSSWFLPALCALECDFKEGTGARRANRSPPWPSIDIALHIKACLLLALIEQTAEHTYFPKFEERLSRVQERIARHLDPGVSAKLNGYAANWRGAAIENLVASALSWHADLFSNPKGGLWDLFCVAHHGEHHGKSVPIQIKWRNRQGVEINCLSFNAMKKTGNGLIFVGTPEYSDSAASGNASEGSRRIVFSVYKVRDLVEKAREAARTGRDSFWVIQEPGSKVEQLHLILDPVFGAVIDTGADSEAPENRFIPQNMWRQVRGRTRVKLRS